MGPGIFLFFQSNPLTVSPRFQRLSKETKALRLSKEGKSLVLSKENKTLRVSK